MQDEHYLSEMFSTIQGEGKYIGTRQIFIRYCSCNLQCSYCDTPVKKGSLCRVELTPGLKNFLELPNPISSDTVIRYIEAWRPRLHHAVSFTGGEPLLNPVQLKQLMIRVRELGLKVLLETNGTLYKELLKVLGFVDIISMDIKLPEFTGESYFKQHEKFLRNSLSKDIYIKIVISSATDIADFMNAVQLVAKIDKTIPIIIQPVSSQEMIAPNPEQLLSFQAEALEILTSVRVIPQTHKFLNQL